MTEIVHKCNNMPDNYVLKRVAGKWKISDGENEANAQYCPFCGYFLAQLKSPAEKRALWRAQENEKPSLPALTDRY